MSKDDDSPSGKLSAAKAQAQQALDSARDQAQQAIGSARDYIASADIDQLKSKAADTASALYKQGRDLATSDQVTQTTDQIAASIRKNPLAAVGVAFAAGLVLALLARG
jgi:ElaB/YqjD/DUF883 family membrane-anchored ribosome-binding protein